MTQDLIPQEAEQALERISGEIKTILKKANSVVVSNEKEFTIAATFIGDIKSEIKRVDAMRKDLVDPLSSTVKKINNAFRLRLDPMTEAKDMIENKMKVYYNEKERLANIELAKIQKEREVAEEKARAEAAKLTAKAETMKTEAGKDRALEAARIAEAEAEQAAIPLEIEAVASNIRTESGLTTFRKVWKFEILDKTLVPLQYLSVDDKLVNQDIRNGMREITGLRIYQDNQISTRV